MLCLQIRKWLREQQCDLQYFQQIFIQKKPNIEVGYRYTTHTTFSRELKLKTTMAATLLHVLFDSSNN